MDFAHDQDLFSWIAKDIIVNHHPRLLGQLTSAEGIFIGPLFYYMLVPFILLFNMDPVGTFIPITVIGILTTLSYYFVFSKLFNIRTGLIAAFLHAVLISWAGFDRRIVPSSPSNLWVIWYFYTIINLTRGNLKVFPILGILAGTIWHFHIALAPAFLPLPLALLFAKKFPNLKQIGWASLGFLLPSIPLILFETRHNFQQTFSLINNFTGNHGGSSGGYKLFLVLEMITKNLNGLLLSPQELPKNMKIIVPIILFMMGIFNVYKKLYSVKEFIVLLIWIFGVVVFFSLNSSPIAEYYFYSIEVIFISFFTLFLSYFFKKYRYAKYLIFVLFGVALIKNFYFYTTITVYNKGYVEKKALVEYVVNDAKNNDYPCYAISYITSIGENVGFRYFFYIKNQHLIRPDLDIPVYNIVIPEEYSSEVNKKFGHIGLILPNREIDRQTLKIKCAGENINLTDPMFGYVQ